MALSHKGGDPLSYRDVIMHYNQPSSSGIHIQLNQAMKSPLQHHQHKSKGPYEKDKKMIHVDQKESSKLNQRTSSTYPSKMAETPRYEIRPGSLGENIQYMKDYAIIAKFIGTWPNEQD